MIYGLHVSVGYDLIFSVGKMGRDKRGVDRGPCTKPGCECLEYDTEGSLACAYCEHSPIAHSAIRNELEPAEKRRCIIPSHSEVTPIPEVKEVSIVSVPQVIPDLLPSQNPTEGTPHSEGSVILEKEVTPDQVLSSQNTDERTSSLVTKLSNESNDSSEVQNGAPNTSIKKHFNEGRRRRMQAKLDSAKEGMFIAKCINDEWVAQCNMCNTYTSITPTSQSHIYSHLETTVHQMNVQGNHGGKTREEVLTSDIEKSYPNTFKFSGKEAKCTRCKIIISLSNQNAMNNIKNHVNSKGHHNRSGGLLKFVTPTKEKPTEAKSVKPSQA